MIKVFTLNDFWSQLFVFAAELSEAFDLRSSVKMVFLEILKIYRKSTFVGVSNLMKLHDFSKTIKREIQTQVFPCEFYETFKPRKTVRSI